jgi:hypothetical protein
MNPKHRVSLQLAKELKEAGFPQKGEFWWKEDLGIPNLTQFNSKLCSTLLGCKYYVAPLATEILEKLPKAFKEDDYQISIETEYEQIWCVMYSNIHTNIVDYEERDLNLCDALARMWLHLKKEGLLKED